jgi:hypothetical protein
MTREPRNDREAHAVIGFHGDMRPGNGRFFRTSTGIEIGSAYDPPPPPPSADAVRVQAALLKFDRDMGNRDTRKRHMLRAWVNISGLIGWVVAAFKQRSPL